MLDITIERFMAEDKMALVAKFDNSVIAQSGMADHVLREIARMVAERYVAENFQAICEHLSPEAVANLSIAESAAKIRETLEKKIPDKILEITKTKTEVYRRGILGGMSRIL